MNGEAAPDRPDDAVLPTLPISPGATEEQEAAATAHVPVGRKLIGFFPVDASQEAVTEAIVEAIFATLPPDDPARIAWEKERKGNERKP